jgi:hypothetical protein
MLNSLFIPRSDFERAWWRLFQKSVVRTNFVIYVFKSTRREKMFDETERVLRSRNMKKTRQHIGQNNENRNTSNGP